MYSVSKILGEDGSFDFEDAPMDRLRLRVQRDEDMILLADVQVTTAESPLSLVLPNRR
jgi:hypothetical protein